MSLDLTTDDVELLLQDKAVKEALNRQGFNDRAQNKGNIDNAYKFKELILKLESSAELKDLLSRDIMLANMDRKLDKPLTTKYLQLSSKFLELKLYKPAKYFYKQALIVAGVSRGVEGWQQDKLNEDRNIQSTQISGLKDNSSSGFGFKRNR